MPVDHVPLIAALSRSDKTRFFMVLAWELTSERTSGWRHPVVDGRH